MTHSLPPVLDLDELRAYETQHAAQPLMERAGLAAAEVARAMLGERGGPIVVLAGPGNNGRPRQRVTRFLAKGERQRSNRHRRGRP
jgi:NAD(P)H-hydrate repair Nnr-like enzyme with NAD(P)H-hydrate epimerase domain